MELDAYHLADWATDEYRQGLLTAEARIQVNRDVNETLDYLAALRSN